MVCMGNICRSPTAHGVLKKIIKSEGLSSVIQVDSAGTVDYHIGAPPDPRSVTAAARRGYDLSPLRARQVRPQDFSSFHYIFAMDRMNMKDLRTLCPPGQRTKLHFLLEFADTSHEGVPDPYYGGPGGFELVLDLVEQACAGVLQHLRAVHNIPGAVNDPAH